jgi:hypothetical protein
MARNKQTSPPGQDELVQVRFGDLESLQARADDGQASLRDAYEDLMAITGALQIKPIENITATQLVADHIVPKIRGLMAMQAQLDIAESELRSRLTDTAAPVIDLGGGQKAVRVGQRLPPGFISKTPQR